MDIKLNKATLEDLKTVALIEKLANSKTYHGLTNEEDLLNYINKSEVFLIKGDDKVLGLVSFKVKDNIASCNGLVICPEFRRRGYAKEAMKIAINEFKNCDRIDLVVHPKNSPAISLYLSLGFNIEEYKENYFGDGEPRIFMVFSD